MAFLLVEPRAGFFPVVFVAALRVRDSWAAAVEADAFAGAALVFFAGGGGGLVLLRARDRLLVFDFAM